MFFVCVYGKFPAGKSCDLGDLSTIEQPWASYFFGQSGLLKKGKGEGTLNPYHFGIKMTSML